PCSGKTRRSAWKPWASAVVRAWRWCWNGWPDRRFAGPRPGPVAARISTRSAAELATAVGELRAALDSDRWTDLLRRLDALVEGPVAGPVGAGWVTKRVRRAVRRADRRLDGALAGGGP